MFKCTEEVEDTVGQERSYGKILKYTLRNARSLGFRLSLDKKVSTEGNNTNILNVKQGVFIAAENFAAYTCVGGTL